jgi:hypothetical protein
MPNRLLNKVAQHLSVSSYSQLALVLDCDPALICRVHRRQVQVSSWLMVRIMDRTGWTITYVRELAGMEIENPVTLLAKVARCLPRGRVSVEVAA